MAKAKGLTSRDKDFPQWYQEVVKTAQLAQHSPVKGCMVIRPYGYAIWENIQRQLDDRIKDTGHENAYFPMFIPESFINREKEHIEGFAPECAVVTHAGGEKLEENLFVRPTSETIIGDTFQGWVESYRDLPLLINQWANVVRWEKRTRLFLRTSEFLWQEGHTAHETAEEAQEETLKMLNVYKEFAENVLGMPVITGEKPAHERFAGADATYSIESMMYDRKALQAGTSHNLGQRFAKQFNIQYLSRNQSKEFAWTTSWGVSTRLIGGLIMTHGDDKGLIVPPRVAPIHIVIVPIFKKPEDLQKLADFIQPIIDKFHGTNYGGIRLRVKFDTRDTIRPGSKFFEWERKGVPLRVEVGMRDYDKQQIVYVRRDTGEKTPSSVAEFCDNVIALLDDIQKSIFAKAKAYREEHTTTINTVDELRDYFTPENTTKPEIHAGFALCHYAGNGNEPLMKELKITARNVPMDAPEEPGQCLITGQPTNKRMIISKAY